MSTVFNCPKILIDGMIFPPIIYWAHFSEKKQILVDTECHYVKKSLRNRYFIVTAQGLLSLSIPLKKGKNNQQALSQVKIDNHQKWQINHLRSMQTAYGKTPYFIHYKELVDEILLTPFEFLVDLQVKALTGILSAFGLDPDIKYLTEYTTKSSSDTFVAKNLYQLNDALPLDLFPPYHQVHSRDNGFIPNASILDILFHMGPEAVNYFNTIKEQSRQLLKTNSIA
jgi:WbqC-like protein family